MAHILTLRTFVHNQEQVTIRKQNGLGVFATQMPSQLLKSAIASELVEQVATEIYLPNPKANRREYTEEFHLTDAEFNIVSTLAEDSRIFLVKQGHQSALARLDFGSDFGDELAIMSGSTENVELAHEVMGKVGDDPAAWEPEFHRRRKLRMVGTATDEVEQS